jgi:hypothetical protein
MAGALCGGGFLCGRGSTDGRSEVVFWSSVLQHCTVGCKHGFGAFYQVVFFFLLFSVIKRRRLMGQWWWSVCSSVMWRFMHTNKVVYFNNLDKENALTVFTPYDP